jgi:hypothetical protein
MEGSARAGRHLNRERYLDLGGTGRTADRADRVSGLKARSGWQDLKYCKPRSSRAPPAARDSGA